MPQPDAGDGEEDLLSRMRELEARLARLEQRFETAGATEPAPHPLTSEPAQAAWAEGRAAVPALGLSILGMAGAYALRALTESQGISQTIGVSAGIAYAVLWLVWSARTPPDRKAKAVLYSLTSALVLGPLLWESTLRFRVISTGTAAVILLVFAVFGLCISWSKKLLSVATIATLTAVVTGTALLLGSHDVMPFTFLLLALATAIELSACLGHRVSERWLAAAAADLAVLLATYLVTNARGLPATYVPISHGSVLVALTALPAIYLSSLLIRTLARGSTFTVFDMAQLGIAFSLAVGGGLRLDELQAGPAVAAVCLGCGAICYAAGFRFRGRNRHAYHAFGLLLVAAAAAVLLPPALAAAAWGGMALVCLALARSLAWHGCGYLLLSLAASGTLGQATLALMGRGDSHPTRLLLVVETAIAMLCYFLAVRGEQVRIFLRAFLAGAAFWPAAGLTAAVLTGLSHAVFGSLAAHAYCATIRTTVLAAGALLLAKLGSASGKYPELVPLVYPVMVFGAYRVLLIDLRQDSKAALVFSLLAYGAALMLLPRFFDRRQTVAR